MMGHIFYNIFTIDLYTITNFKSETAAAVKTEKLQQNANNQINNSRVLATREWRYPYSRLVL